MGHGTGRAPLRQRNGSTYTHTPTLTPPWAPGFPGETIEVVGETKNPVVPGTPGTHGGGAERGYTPREPLTVHLYAGRRGKFSGSLGSRTRLYNGRLRSLGFARDDSERAPHSGTGRLCGCEISSARRAVLSRRRGSGSVASRTRRAVPGRGAASLAGT